MTHEELMSHLDNVIYALENDTGATWTLGDYDTDFDVETWSDAGEDVIISLHGTTLEQLATDAENAASNFDAEEHASKIFLAKREGSESARRYYEAAPDSLSELLRDAEQIHGLHRALAAMLKLEAEKAKKARVA